MCPETEHGKSAGSVLEPELPSLLGCRCLETRLFQHGAGALELTLVEFHPVRSSASCGSIGTGAEPGRELSATTRRGLAAT